MDGLGEKQDDDFLHNYTVAKITCDCDFTGGSIKKITQRFTTTTNASGNEIKQAVIDSNNQYVYDDVLDSNGNTTYESIFETKKVIDNVRGYL